MAADRSYEETFRQMATLLAVQMEMDSGDPAKLRKASAPDGEQRTLALWRTNMGALACGRAIGKGQSPFFEVMGSNTRRGRDAAFFGHVGVAEQENKTHRERGPMKTLSSRKWSRAVFMRLLVFALRLRLRQFDKGNAPAVGKRMSVMPPANKLKVDPSLSDFQVSLPEPAANRDWAQSGGTVDHAPGHLSLAKAPAEVWSASVGSGSGKSFKLLSRPIIGSNAVYTMDAIGRVSAFDLSHGERHWRVDTTPSSRAATRWRRDRFGQQYHLRFDGVWRGCRASRGEARPFGDVRWASPFVARRRWPRGASLSLRSRMKRTRSTPEPARSCGGTAGFRKMRL